ncbi:uncharacterized protein LOC144100418 isoform X1 [Amblyomma americanum]
MLMNVVVCVAAILVYQDCFASARVNYPHHYDQWKECREFMHETAYCVNHTPLDGLPSNFLLESDFHRLEYEVHQCYKGTLPKLIHSAQKLCAHKNAIPFMMACFRTVIFDNSEPKYKPALIDWTDKVMKCATTPYGRSAIQDSAIDDSDVD